MWEPTRHPGAATMPSVLFGGRGDGDASGRHAALGDGVANSVGDPAELAVNPGLRRAELLGRPCSWLRQVHGAAVWDADAGPVHGRDGDALVATIESHALTIATADCAPVVLWGTSGEAVGVIGACHAGWRGLAAGVVEATCRHMRVRGAREIHAVLGPCISPAAYEFGDADLTSLALQFGPEVVAATSDGAPAFDLRAAVRSAARSGGVEPSSLEWLAANEPPCTALDAGFYSWRARGERGRNLTAVWQERRTGIFLSAHAGDERGVADAD